MIIQKYKAKSLNTDHYVYGSYFQMPKISICCEYNSTEEDRLKKEQENTAHYIINYHQGDWGLPNELRATEIDPTTLTMCDDCWEI